MKYKRSILIFFFLLFSFFSISLYAQEAAEEASLQEASFEEEQEAAGEDILDGDELAQEEESAEEIEVKEPKVSEKERQLIELELKSSTLPELAAWCQTLGLSEGGTRTELVSRIREHFEVSEEEGAADEERKIITIESAQVTEYFSIDIVGEDYARLKGDVRISLRDKDDEHNIKADEIIFNRTRNIITAKGNVEYYKKKDDTTEIFHGQNITVNIDNWASIFLDGNSVRSLDNDDGTAYSFSGAVISITEDDVMILRKAQIKNARNPEALWSINASRLWLLPGSDFAIFNAWLKVGEIPVLYIPFFFFAADDLIFRPVLGYRTREGGFVQTTTYILGRPKANSVEQSSITRIIGSASDMERERQGIFLRSTGKKMKDPNETSLKVLLDYYANLGAYTGLDFSLPRIGILNPLEFSMGLGFTRTLTRIGGEHTPYAPNFDGTFERDHSNLFSTEVPFRYRLKTNSSISGRFGSLSWDFPFYSDPYMDKDFLARAEAMDWMNMMTQGAAVEDDAITETDISSYQWQMSGNLNPQLSFLSPFVSNISLSNISTTLAFKTIKDKEVYDINDKNPASFFFAPDKYTIYSASASISGTPLSIGGQNLTNTASNTAEEEAEDPLKGIGTPRSPWTKEEEEAPKSTNDDKLIPPALSQRFDMPSMGSLKFSVDYQLAPTSSTELQFMSGYDRWQKFDQVSWDEIQSILTSFGGNASLNFHMDHSSGLFSNIVTFSGSGTWRDYSFLNEEAEAYRTPQTSEGEMDETKVEDAKKQQYRQTNYNTSYAYNGTVRPIYDNPIFGQSNLQYGFRGTLVRSKRYEDTIDSPRTAADGPELTPQWGVWAKEETKDGEDIYGLNSHKLSANIAANIMDNQQNFTVTADLPPFDPLFSTNATFRVWISETNARIDFKKPEKIDNEPNFEWKKDPLHLTETLKLGKAGTFSYYMVVDPEEDNEITTVTSSLTLWSFRASFSAIKSLKYEFEFNNPEDTTQGGAWKQTEDEPALHPRDLTFTYNPTFSNIFLIKDRLRFSLNLNTRLFFDLQRHTNSNFQFTMGFTLGVVGFMDLSISATSENAVIFRYFKGISSMKDLTAMYIDGDQNNFFVDLFDSFNFSDESKRQRSGFKMKSFNLTAIHYLGDWKAEFGLRMSPYLNNDLAIPKYEINTEISFLVQWTAITEIKTDLNYEKRTEKWIKR